MRIPTSVIRLFCFFVGLTALAAQAGVAEGLEAYERFQNEEARKELTEPAAKGDPEAMAVMGDLLLRGLGGPRDEARARDYVLQSHRLGSLRGTFIYANLLMFGWMVPKDENRGIELVKEVANKGFTWAQVRVGNWIAEGSYGYQKNDTVALTWFKSAADKNDSLGMTWVGLFYEQGRGGLAKDPLVALEWFKKAAERNNRHAMLALGRIYATGKAGVFDGIEGLKWFELAALRKLPEAYLWIASLYEYGASGVTKNPSVAYSWLSALPVDATEEQLKDANTAKDRLAKVLSSSDIDAAIRQSRNVVDTALSAAATTLRAETSKAERKGVYGSGVVVSRFGDIITNEHVIQGCSNVRIQPQGNQVKIVAKDEKNDLALLRLEGMRIPSVRTRSGRGIRLGDELVAVGYPLRGLISTGPTVTTGIVNALSGVNNDTSAFQMSATVQPGSSGGPIVDTHGLLVGIVRSRLLPNGPISPQNVNFGINLATVQSFLEAHSVDYESSTVGNKPMSVGDVTALTQRSTVQVECY